MKKVIIYLLALLTICCSLSGCIETETYQNEKMTIAVSIVPEATFVEKVCGDNFDIITMIPSGASPETYEPTFSQMKKLSEADIYFAMGVPAEEKIVSEIGENTKLVNLHNQVSCVYPDRNEDHGRDPHIWLSPKRVIVIIKSIAENISLIDPKNSDMYRNNSNSYIGELEMLDREVNSLLSNKQNRKFIAFHSAFGYFADDYNLQMYALEEHGKEASAQRLADMIDLAKSQNIKTIFYQEETSGRQAKAFAEEIGGKAVSLAPLAADYIKNIKEMTIALSEAMK